MKLGIVSLFANILHLGHIEYINAAKKDCDFLIAVINNDFQVGLKKSTLIMDQMHRRDIVANLKSVDCAIISTDSDSSICKTLLDIFHGNYCDLNSYDNISSITFYNSGDRKLSNTNIYEEELCVKLNIHTKFLDLPKIYSSTDFRYTINNI